VKEIGCQYSSLWISQMFDEPVSKPESELIPGLIVPSEEDNDGA
jgi:hypothetical protein